MSGRALFTAGTTLTAADVNAYIMNGIPYKIVAGTATVTGSLAITFAASFTSGVTPIITTSIGTNNTVTGGIVTHGNVTNTGVTLYVWIPSTNAAGTAAKTVHFTAIQMTSTTGAGNS